MQKEITAGDTTLDDIDELTGLVQRQGWIESIGRPLEIRGSLYSVGILSPLPSQELAPPEENVNSSIPSFFTCLLGILSIVGGWLYLKNNWNSANGRNAIVLGDEFAQTPPGRQVSRSTGPSRSRASTPHRSRASMPHRSRASTPHRSRASTPHRRRASTPRGPTSRRNREDPLSNLTQGMNSSTILDPQASGTVQTPQHRYNTRASCTPTAIINSAGP